MRFEVKGGGIAGILFALIILSCAVFVLGLLAGYDVGRQAQLDTAQLATSYPIQSPPSSSSSTASNESPAEPANPSMQSAASSTASMSAEGGTPVAAAFAGGSISPKHRPSQRLAPSASTSAAEPLSSTAGLPGADEDNGAAGSENPEAAYASSEPSGNANPQAGRRVASTASSTRHKPYNIQIEAAMDKSSAGKMMARLQKLGYPSHVVPAQIAGQRWYKVEVGPYATAEDASNAEVELRQKYNATYGGVARGNSAGQPGADDNSEE